MKKELLLLLTISIGTLVQGQEKFDTIIETNHLKIKISRSDSTNFPPYFENPGDIYNISKQYSNFHERSLAIEKYQINFYKLNIGIDSLDRIVTLSNGKIIKLSPNNKFDEYCYAFEKFFKEYGFLLFRVQWFEGNNYFLLNTLTGEKTYVGGRVYFSPDGKYFISVEDDIDANYCFNGFQLFSIGSKGQLEKIWQYSPFWGPGQIKWIDNNRLVTRGYIYDRNYKMETFFKELEFTYLKK